MSKCLKRFEDAVARADLIFRDRLGAANHRILVTLSSPQSVQR